MLKALQRFAAVACKALLASSVAGYAATFVRSSARHAATIVQSYVTDVFKEGYSNFLSSWKRGHSVPASAQVGVNHIFSVAEAARFDAVTFVEHFFPFVWSLVAGPRGKGATSVKSTTLFPWLALLLLLLLSISLIAVCG